MKNLKSFVFYIFMTLIFTSISCLADPAPFGLELGKANLKDIEGKYKIIGIEYSEIGAKAVKVETNLVGLEGLKSLIFFVSDKEELLQGVLLIMENSKFQDMLDSLSKKYKLVSKNIPFVGDKSVSFEDGDSIIELESPHLKSEMVIMYKTKNFDKTIEKKVNEEKARQKNKERDLL